MLKPLTKLFLTLLLVPASALSQETWARIEKTDALRGTSYTRFTLGGKFLEAPQQGRTSSPTLVVDCDPSYKGRWGDHGKTLSAYIAVGAIIDSGSYGDPEAVTVQYRLDDGKVKTDRWSHSTNFSAIFLGGSFRNEWGNTKNDFDVILGELLYTHKAVRKEKTSVPARKAVIQVPEFLSGNVTMEFDLPDPTEVADSCGLFVWNK